MRFAFSDPARARTFDFYSPRLEAPQNGTERLRRHLLSAEWLLPFFLCWLKRKKFCCFVLVRLLSTVIYFDKGRMRISGS